MSQVVMGFFDRLYLALRIDNLEEVRAGLSKKIVNTMMTLVVLIILRTIFLLFIEQPFGWTLFSLICNLFLCLFGLSTIRVKGKLLMVVFIGIMSLHAVACMIRIGIVVDTQNTKTFEY